VEPDDVLREFGYQPDLVFRDARNLLLAAPRLSDEERQKVQTLTDSVRLRAFVEVDDSTVLLVRGGRGSRNNATRSATSNVAARLSLSLIDIAARGSQRSGAGQSGRRGGSGGAAATVCAAAFFCGEHRSDEFSSARALIITLMLQLVERHGHLLPSSLLRKCRDAMLDLDMEGLCELLTRLARALPPEAVLFVVVDAVSFFEWPASRLRDTQVLVERLVALGRERADEVGGPRVKVLFTTPTRCLHLEALFEDYEVLTVRNNVALRGRPGDRQWGASRLGASVSALSDSEY
jgi:hypothetical protein